MLLALGAEGAAAQTALSARLAAAALPQGVTEIALLDGWRRADGAHVAAIAIRLAPGWYTYWRAPGATGIPPQFDWSASSNLASVAYEWPRPVVFDSFGSPTIGYKEALVLPVVLTPERAEAPLEASVDVVFGVCRDICIPAEARLVARLEPTSAAPEGRAEIERALASRPVDGRAAGVTEARCALSAAAGGHELSAEITFDEAPAQGALTTVIEADARPDLWIGAAETRMDGRRVHATARLDATRPGGIALDRGGLRVTLLGDGRAIDIRGCPSAE